MATFLVLYRAPVSAMQQMASATPEQAQAGMDAWMRWAGEAGERLKDLGNPLNRVTTVGAPVPDDASPIAGYSMLEAASAEEAGALLQGHPHLQLPGASIELLEAVPVPGM